MSKPKMYGAKTSYIPNAKSDMRYKPHIYQRGREYANSADERRENKLIMQMEQLKRSEKDGNQRTD